MSVMSDSARVAARSHSPSSLLGSAIGGSQRGDRSRGRESRDDAWRDVLRRTTHGDDAPYKASSRSSSHRVVESALARQRRHSFRFNFFLLAPYSSSSRAREPASCSVFLPRSSSAPLFFFSRVGFSQSPRRPLLLLLLPSTYPRFFLGRARRLPLFSSVGLFLSLSIHLPAYLPRDLSRKTFSLAARIIN